jgi:hypothetical protein
MQFKITRVEIAPIMQASSGIVQGFALGDLPRPRVHEKTVRALLRHAPSFIAGGSNTGVPYTVKDVAHALHADNALTVIAIALDLLALQEQGAVTPEALERLTAGLTVTALRELVKTLKATQREREEIEAEQKL